MKMKLPISITIAGATALALSSCGRDDEGGEKVTIAGSDTMLQVGLAWQDAYKSVASNVALSVEGEGSSTGFKALIDKTAEIAHSSRQIKESEAEKIKAAHNGTEAVEHIVGFDGIAVFMHPDNPVKSISVPELKEIWAAGGTINNWNQVGGSDSEIQRMGRSNSSGTYGYFQKAILGKNAEGKGLEYKPGTGAANGSQGVVEFCSTTPSGIGYSGMSYKNDTVGWLSVSAEKGGEAIEPSIANVQNKTYPIARPLYIYTVGEPDPDSTVGKYLAWIKGEGGQEVVSAQGFVPIN